MVNVWRIDTAGLANAFLVILDNTAIKNVCAPLSIRIAGSKMELLVV